MKDYQARQSDKLWDRLWRTKRPINKNKPEDNPFNVEVTGKGTNISISIKPDIRATTNEVLPLVTKTLIAKITPFETTRNTPGNRERMTKELVMAIENLWVQGLIEPKPEEEARED